MDSPNLRSAGGQVILKWRCRTSHGDEETRRFETTKDRVASRSVACACSIATGRYAGRIVARERARADEASKGEAGLCSA